MKLSDVLFLLGLGLICLALIAQLRFKKDWISNFFIACAFAILGFRIYMDDPDWFVMLYAFVVFVLFAKAYFTYPAQYERIESGQTRLPKVLLWIVFDAKTAKRLGRQKVGHEP